MFIRTELENKIKTGQIDLSKNNFLLEFLDMECLELYFKTKEEREYIKDLFERSEWEILKEIDKVFDIIDYSIVAELYSKENWDILSNVGTIMKPKLVKNKIFEDIKKRIHWNDYIFEGYVSSELIAKELTKIGVGGSAKQIIYDWENDSLNREWYFDWDNPWTEHCYEYEKMLKEEKYLSTYYGTNNCEEEYKPLNLIKSPCANEEIARLELWYTNIQDIRTLNKNGELKNNIAKVFSKNLNEEEIKKVFNIILEKIKINTKTSCNML
ncbi:MAG: hypothetical protein ACRC4M_00775 [Mycoplasma sp.]